MNDDLTPITFSMYFVFNVMVEHNMQSTIMKQRVLIPNNLDGQNTNPVVLKAYYGIIHL